MKKALLSLVLSFVSFCSYAQTSDEELNENVFKFNSAKTTEEYYSAANNFATIIGKGKKDWRSYYYASLSIVRTEMIAQQQGKTQGINGIVASAKKYLTPIKELEQTNSEINILLAQISILNSFAEGVDKNLFLSNAEKYVTKAELLDKNNPRIDIIKGQISLQENKNLAKVYFENAKTKLKNYAPKSKLDPTWGEKDVEYFLSIIK